MAAKHPADFERLEDIYQDEIILEFSSILDFKKFARSKDGLCLDETDIQQIAENNPDSVVEQKMQMLKKWEEKTGATAHKIRSVVKRFRDPESEEGYVRLSEEYVLHTNEKISEKSLVYLGEQISPVTGSREVVIKLVEFGEKNKREADILVKLSAHQNVVAMFHTGIFKTPLAKYFYIVMESCRRDNLGNYLRKLKESGLSLDASQKMAVAKQFYEGLNFIHANRIIHRDIKLQNLLITKDGKFIKITDFGLSKTLSLDQSITKVTCEKIGTEGYLSPEAFKLDGITQKSDIFVSGIVVYWIVSDGRHAYGSDPLSWNTNIKNNRNFDISCIFVPDKKQMKRLLNWAFQRNPEKRPTAAEILAEKIFQQSTTSLELPENFFQANAIIFFDKYTMHLQSYKPSTNQLDQMQRIVKRLENKFFTLVALGKNTYALCKQKMYRLKYSDSKAKWDQVKGTNEDHGRWPPAVALNGSIYVCGTGGNSLTSSSVEMYNTDTDIWIIIPGITIARVFPCVVAAKDCIYCIGGEDQEGNELRSVQRLEVETGTVTEVDPIPRPIEGLATAVEKDEILYVADDVGIECYDIQKNSWETMKTDQWPPARSIIRTNIHFVDDQLHVVFYLGLSRVEIYKLNQTTGKMTLLEKREDVLMWYTSSVAVKL